MREKMAQRLRRLVVVTGLTLALVLILFSSVFAQDSANSTLPIGTGSCGLIVAQVFPSFDSAQTVVQGSTGARTIGAILAKGNDMVINANGQVMNKETSENGRFWTMPISGTSSITVTTSSGPDKPWGTIAAAAGLRRLVVSLGNQALDDNVYESVILNYTAYNDKVSGCLVGAYNAANDGLPISLIVRVANVEKVHTKIEASQIGGMLDLIAFEAQAKIGDDVEIEITNLESPNQDRAGYFLAGIVVQGASQSGQVIDNDGDGLPDNEDPRPTVKDCFVTAASYGGPYEVFKSVKVDMQFTGYCGGVGLLRHMEGTLIEVLRSDGTTVLQPDPQGVQGTCQQWDRNTTACVLDNGFYQFRVTILPTRAGEQEGFINVGFVQEALRFWSYIWNIKGANLFVPIVLR